MRVEILADFNLAVAQADCQTDKFNSPPNFLAIQYKSLVKILANENFVDMVATSALNNENLRIAQSDPISHHLYHTVFNWQN